MFFFEFYKNSKEDYQGNSFHEVKRKQYRRQRKNSLSLDPAGIIRI